MPGEPDPHEVLGVSAEATQEQITRAFRSLARRYHPDVRGGDEAAFARVRAAYEALSARARRTGRDEAASPRRGRSEGVSVPVRVRSHTPRRGADVSAEVTLDLARAVFGATAVIDPDHENRVSFRIPPGVAHRERLRIVGQGREGSHGGPPGDLLVTVLVAEHPTYWRAGRDLGTVLNVSYPEAALGATVSVVTLQGEELPISIPPATPHGHHVRVPGHGVPGDGRHAPGDLVVEVAIDVPTHVSSEQREALERLAAIMPPPGKEPRR